MGKVAVLGASGFIGSHLVARLKAAGHWVRAVDIRERLDRIELYGLADEVRFCDLRHLGEAHWALEEADWVFHLAADHGGAGFFHSDHDYPAAKNNAWIDMNVLHACEILDIERLFYASSFCAYPTELQDKPYALSEKELTAGTPEQLYGGVKRQTTLFCEKAPFDARAGIFATIYGPGQEADGIRAKFPTAITKRILESNGQPIELWGNGSQVRTFLYIDDAIERIVKVMSEPYRGPVNIASDEAVKVLDCATWVCQHAGVKPVFDHRFDMPTGVKARVPDNGKWEKTYGPPSQTPAKVGFVRLYDFMKENLVAAQ